MLDRINQWIEQFLVGLGLALNGMSTDETTMVSLLLGFLMLAMAVSRVLRFARIGQ